MKNNKVLIKEEKPWLKLLLLLIVVLISLGIYIVGKTTNLASEDFSEKTEKRPNCTCPIDNNLPIVVIDTNNQKIEVDKAYVDALVNGKKREILKKSPKYINVDFKLYEKGDYSYTNICGSEEATIESKIKINTRGQSSLFNPKKQYSLGFQNEDGSENPLEILDMPKHDKWVLNGSYEDKSLIRNHLAYKMADGVMEYAPRTRYVEVYLNDTGDKDISFDKHYIGVYLLTEKIERNINRVNIDKNQEAYKDVSFIIARDKIKLGDKVIGTQWGDLEDDLIIDQYGEIRPRTVLTVSYPGPSNLTEKHEKSILKLLDSFEYTLRSSDFNNRKTGYRSFIDVDSFVNFAIINDIFKNIDGGDASTYFYKDIGGLIKAGPLWDFDLTLGNTSDVEVNDPSGFMMTNTIWFDRLFQDKYFANRYSKILYPYYRNEKWRTNKVHTMVDEAVEELGPAAIRNSQKWYDDYGEKEYDEEIKNMKIFLEKRLNWMDENVHIIKRLQENVIE